jgi:glyceraldehyde-3-phosphate dehydrogenase/erythrose-4-phosphate dehydrogenase
LLKAEGFEAQSLAKTTEFGSSTCTVTKDMNSQPRHRTSTRVQVIDGTMVKIYAWYDNEFGYAQRMVDIAVMVAKSIMH